MKKNVYTFLVSAFLVLCLSNQAFAQFSWQQAAPGINGLAANENEGAALSFAADGNTFATTAANIGNTQNLQGRVRIFTKSGANWIQKGGNLVGAASGDFFGRSIALDSTGNTIVVGAPYNDAGLGSFSNAGHVRVFSWVSGSWVQKGATLLADSAGDNFGYSVSISYDGNTIAIGSPFRLNKGRVKVYRWVSGAWVQLGANLDGTNNFDVFGNAVSLDRTGNILAIGAPFNGAGGSEAGQVKIFNWNGTAWTQRGGNINGSTSDYSGTNLSLSANGNRVAIGSPQDIIFGGFGIARVYDFNGTAWTQAGSSLISPNFADAWGDAIRISGDGSRLAVGARTEVPGNERGRAQVFAWSGTNWLAVGDTLRGDSASHQFGSAVSLNYNGNSLIVGASNAGTNAVGVTRLFEWSNTTCVATNSTINPTQCGGTFTSPSGKYVYTSNGTYRDTIQNVAGCDSIITINLTINPVPIVNLGNDTSICSTSTPFTLNAGNSGSTYLWSSSDTTQNISITTTGSYFVRVTKNGCTTHDTISITVNNVSINDSVTINGNVFTAVDSTATYQWLDCTNNNQPITGATNRSFNVFGCMGNSLNYAVRITKNGCVVTSACQQLSLNWAQQGQDIDGEVANDNSGASVSLSADGRVMAIGAPKNGGNGTNAGHVRVYAWNGSAWLQRGADINGEAADDESGSSVSLSANGNILAIGAPYNDGNGTNSGHVRVYAWSGNVWVQQGADINGESGSSWFGSTVSLSANGDILAAAGPVNGGNGLYAGHVRVYTWNGNNWVQRGTDIDGKAAEEEFGFSISLSASGNVLAIGSIRNNANGYYAGQVRVYAWNGTAWAQRGADINGEGAGDQSGHSVSLSANGDVLAIGAPHNDGNGSGSGHVRVFTWSGNAWVQRGANINGQAADDLSGGSVSLTANGDVIAIGAGAKFFSGGGTYAGRIRVYAWNGNAWVQRGVDLNGEATDDESGRSVSLSSNGNILAIGAVLNDGNGANSGHVRVFRACNFDPLIVNLGPDQNICGNAASVVLNAGNPGSAYLWSTGDTTQTITVSSTGTYFVKVTNGIQMAFDTVSITVTTMNKNVTLSANVFTALDSTASYQWLDCANNNAIIPNATSRSITVQGCAGQSFNYAVVLSKNGCVDTSACQTLNITWSQVDADIPGASSGNATVNSVAMSANGSIIAVGAPNLTTGNSEVRVFRVNNEKWIQLGQTLKSTNTSPDQSRAFGISVALSADGLTLAVGSPLEGKGVIYVYSWDGNNWVVKGGSNLGPAVIENFNERGGQSVSLSADGNVLAYSNQGKNLDGGSSSGFRILTWNDNTWNTRTYWGGSISVRWGHSIAVSAHGRAVAITQKGGLNWVYESQDGISWYTRRNSIIKEDPNALPKVALSADGFTLVLRYNKGDSSEYITTYRYNGNNYEKIAADLITSDTTSDFASNMALNADATKLLLGYPGNGATSHVKTYQLSNGVWQLIPNQITVGTSTSNMGYALAASADCDLFVTGGQATNSVVRVFKQCTFAVSVEEKAIISAAADNNNEYTVYPNPTTGLFRVKTHANEDIQSVSVYNSVGELVLNQHITTNEQELDLQNQPAGIYFVRITTTNGYSTQRLVIQH